MYFEIRQKKEQIDPNSKYVARIPILITSFYQLGHVLSRARQTKRTETLTCRLDLKDIAFTRSREGGCFIFVSIEPSDIGGQR
jgi:hypothetical protein